MQTTPLLRTESPLASISAPELVERCGARDCEESWQEFLNRYGWALAATVRRALAGVGRALSHDVQEDLLQEIYCRLLADGRRRLRSCRGEDDRTVTGYLCRIAENVVIDHLRRSNAVKRGRQLLVASPGAGDDCPLERAVDPASSAERRALVAQSRRLFFARAGRALCGPNRQRDLWVTYLALFEGWSSREIARRFGTITANNVDSVVYRTRRRLRTAGIELGQLATRR